MILVYIDKSFIWVCAVTLVNMFYILRNQQQIGTSQHELIRLLLEDRLWEVRQGANTTEVEHRYWDCSRLPESFYFASTLRMIKWYPHRDPKHLLLHYFPGKLCFQIDLLMWIKLSLLCNYIPGRKWILNRINRFIVIEIKCNDKLKLLLSKNNNIN